MNTTDFGALASLLSQHGMLVGTIRPQADLAITGADCDSRLTLPGHLLVCKGDSFQARYLTLSRNNGAVAYLCDESRASELAAAAPTMPGLITGDIRSAMALVSAEAWGHPDRRMRVVGITGTKGKTTVAYFVRAILDGDIPYSRAASMGTLETYDGVVREPSKNTTPEAPDLWRHLANAANSGLDMVMEVSSQGLKYQRVDGLGLDVAAFLNIGIDHISPIEHPTFEDYLASKLLLFRHARVAVLNANLDPQHAASIVSAARSCPSVRTFSLDGTSNLGNAGDPVPGSPDVWASDLTPHATGIDFTLHTPAWTAPAHIALSGVFNVENALAAATIALELGCTQEQIIAGLAACRVPGRMDLVDADGGRLVAIVDYAHNGMSVQKVLSSVRQSYPNRYIVAVFGATGGKGTERRFEMPPAAAPYADHLIYTEDDAGPEDPARICEQMVAVTPNGASCEVIVDRTRAIEHAIALARNCGREAVVCVLGKGHETRQLRANGPAPMVPDGELVRNLLG